MGLPKRKIFWGTIFAATVMLSFAFLVFAPPAQAQNSLNYNTTTAPTPNPSTPASSSGSFLCRPSEPNEDSSGDVYNCVTRIYNYAIAIGAVVAVIFIIAAGYMYFFSGGGTSSVAKAKNYIETSIAGLIILLGGFLVLKLINPNLLIFPNISPEQIAIGDLEKVVLDGSNVEAGGGFSGQVPSGTAQELAKQILQNGRITLLGDPKGDTKSGAKQNIVDTSNGLAAWTSKRGDSGSVQVPLNAKMLAGILAAAQVRPIQVNFILGGDHEKNSRHYRGLAFDIQTTPTDPKNAGLASACRAAGATEIIGPPQPGHATHVHCGW